MSAIIGQFWASVLENRDNITFPSRRSTSSDHARKKKIWWTKRSLVILKPSSQQKLMWGKSTRRLRNLWHDKTKLRWALNTCFTEISANKPIMAFGNRRQRGSATSGAKQTIQNTESSNPGALEIHIGNAWKGWIEPSSSEFSSPVLILKKSNGKGYRFVVDLRHVNQSTKAFAHYIRTHHHGPRPGTSTVGSRTGVVR